MADPKYFLQSGKKRRITDNYKVWRGIKNKFGLDGAMIGRASIGNPWIFNQIKHYFKSGEKLEEPKLIEKINLVQRHFEMSVKWK